MLEISSMLSSSLTGQGGDTGGEDWIGEWRGVEGREWKLK